MPSPLARPNRERRLSTLSIVGLLVLAGLVGLIGMLILGRGEQSRAYRAPACTTATAVTCPVSWTRTSNGLTVQFNRPPGRTFRYKLGRADDVVMVGNWFCGLTETALLYRPSTGVIYYFPSWPTETAMTNDVLADQTGLIGYDIARGDRNGDGCGDVSLSKGNTITWLRPAVERNRMNEVSGPV
jgi:hypothetical protein